jgi:hypothetical protein
MSHPDSVVHSFDDGDEVVYVHAYRSVMNGWRLGLTVVAGREGAVTTTRVLTNGSDKSFPTADAAALAGRRLAERKQARET